MWCLSASHADAAAAAAAADAAAADDFNTTRHTQSHTHRTLFSVDYRARWIVQ
jgi:hypothetical protein